MTQAFLQFFCGREDTENTGVAASGIATSFVPSADRRTLQLHNLSRHFRDRYWAFANSTFC